MSGFASWFNFGSGSSGSDEIPAIFPLSITEREFVACDTVTLYQKILTDVLERTEGLTDDEQALLWDNCLASESSEGLITLLAKAIVEKSELFLVLDPATKVLRKATNDEMRQIREDYKNQAESAVGTYISFRSYARVDMIKLYSSLEYSTVAGLNKSANLSKAVQIKIDQLRSTVAVADSAEAKSQAQNIATNLSKGKDVLIDAKDTIETAKPDVAAVEASMNLLNQKRSFYLGLPASYITGELNSGLGDTGQADAKAIERGLKGFFVSIVKPVCKSIFGKTLTFKSDDFNQVSTALEVLKTFEITSDEYLSAENKLIVVNKAFGLPADTKGEPPAPEPAAAPPAPNPRAPAAAQ